MAGHGFATTGGWGIGGNGRGFRELDESGRDEFRNQPNKLSGNAGIMPPAFSSYGREAMARARAGAWPKGALSWLPRSMAITSGGRSVPRLLA